MLRHAGPFSLKKKFTVNCCCAFRCTAGGLGLILIQVDGGTLYFDLVGGLRLNLFQVDGDRTCTHPIRAQAWSLPNNNNDRQHVNPVELVCKVTALHSDRHSSNTPPPFTASRQSADFCRCSGDAKA